MQVKKMGSHPISRIPRAALRSLVIAGLCSGTTVAQGPCVLSVYSESQSQAELAKPPSLEFQQELASDSQVCTPNAEGSASSHDLAKAMTQYVVQIVGLGNRGTASVPPDTASTESKQIVRTDANSPEEETSQADASVDTSDAQAALKSEPNQVSEEAKIAGSESLLDLVLPSDMLAEGKSTSGSSEPHATRTSAEYTAVESAVPSESQVFHLSDIDDTTSPADPAELASTADDSIVKSVAAISQAEAQSGAAPTSMPTFQPSLFKPANAGNQAQAASTGPSIVAGSSQRQFALRLVKNSSNATNTDKAVKHQPGGQAELGQASDYQSIVSGMPVVRAVKPPVEPESQEKSEAVPKVVLGTPVVEAVQKPGEQLVRIADKQNMAAKQEVTEKSAIVAAKQAVIEDKQDDAAEKQESRDAKPNADTAKAIADAAKPKPEVASAPARELVESAEAKLCRQLVEQVRQKFPSSRIDIQPHPEEGLIVSGQAASESEARKILTFVRITSLSPTFDEIKSTR